MADSGLRVRGRVESGLTWEPKFWSESESPRRVHVVMQGAGVRRSFNNQDCSGTASQITPQGRHHHANAYGGASNTRPDSTGSVSYFKIAASMSDCTLQDCCFFLQKIAKTFKGSISDNILEDTIESLRKIISLIGASLQSLEGKNGCSSFHLWVPFSLHKGNNIANQRNQMEKMRKMQHRDASKKIQRKLREKQRKSRECWNFFLLSHGKVLRLCFIFHMMFM